MDGVTILTTNVYRELNGVAFAYLMFMFIVLYGLVLVLSYMFVTIGSLPEKTMGVLACLIVSVVLAYGVRSLYTDYQTIHTDYLVTVNDTANINEFVTHYEILKQDGTLFTVRERGDSNE